MHGYAVLFYISRAFAHSGRTEMLFKRRKIEKMRK